MSAVAHAATLAWLVLQLHFWVSVIAAIVAASAVVVLGPWFVAARWAWECRTRAAA